MATPATLPDQKLESSPQIELDPVPVPTTNPVQVQPTPANPGYSPSQGFAGTGGQVANIAANFLHGWMEGKNAKEINNMNMAKQKVASTYQAYQMAMATAANPDLDETSRKNAAQMIPGLKAAYVDTIRSYSGKPNKPDGSQDKGTFMSRLAEAFTGKKPEMFANSMADMMQKSLPEVPPSLSPQQQAGRATAAATTQTAPAIAGATIAGAEASTAHSKAATTSYQNQQQIEKNNATLAAKQQDRDTYANSAGMDPKVLQQKDKEIESIRAQNSQLAGQEPALPGTREVKQLDLTNQKMVLQAKNSGLQSLQGGTNFFALPDDQKLAMGWNPQQHQEIDGYLSEIGPGKKFANQYEAMQALLADRRKFALLGRYPTPIVELENLTHGELQQELSTPEGAAKYGVQPLKPGEDVRDVYPALFGKTVMERYRATPEERRHLTGTERQQMRDNVVQSYIQEHPEAAPFLSWTEKDSKGNEKTRYGLNPNVKPDSHWFSANETPEHFKQRMTSIREGVADQLRDAGVTDRDINAMGFSTPSGMAPTPSASAGGGAANAPQWVATRPDGTPFKDPKTGNAITFDDGGMAAAKEKYPGLKFQKAGESPQPPPQAKPSPITPAAAPAAQPMARPPA